MEARMDFRKLILSMGIAGAVGLVGCGSDSEEEPPPPPPPDPFFEPHQRSTPVPPTSACADTGNSYFYVVSVLDFATTSTETNQTPGFNIDGYNTPVSGTSGCGHPDRRFDVNQDGMVLDDENGIDNQLADLAPLLSGFLSLQDMVDGGDVLILVEAKYVDSLTNDDCVQVDLLLGEVPAGETLVLDASGRIAPGQAFVISDASYDDDGNPLISGLGSIVNGRLYIGPVTLSLSFPVDAQTEITLAIQSAQVAFNISATTLGVGVIGGALNVDALLSAVGGLLPDEFPPDTIRGILEPMMDINPDTNNANCDSVSLGLVFNGVDAEEHEEVL
jgi:hypothetical protein